MISFNADVRTYQPINSYGVIGDCRSVVLVAPDGSVDWGCLPDFDSPAIFCRLLDAEHGGYFQIAPSDASIPGTQHYLSRSNILQTKFTSLFGEISVTENMNTTLIAQAPLQKGDRLLFAMGMAPTVQAAQTLAEFISCQAEFEAALTHTLVCWRMWAAQCSYHGPYAEWVQRSALVLKMLTYAPTGALEAAPTTSLPEEFGGVRNWDYRYTWLRDATFTLYALSVLGYTEESHAFTCWLRNLSYTSGEDLQIMYGIR